jgi:hypothetical protein
MTNEEADGDDSLSDTVTETEEISNTEKETETEGTATPNVYTLKNCSDKLNIIGRCPVTDYGIASSWSASGIEFNVRCDGDVTVGTRSINKKGEYRVFVDGKEHGTISASTMAMKYPLGVDFSSEDIHNIRLYRITNNESGLKLAQTYFVSIILDGELCDVEKDKKVIEFVGDSITCGSGLHASGSGFDGTLAYCFTLAQALGCDHSMVATSGIGVYVGTQRHQDAGANMSKYYEYTNYLESTKDVYVPRKKADLVVINLNTNDNDNGGNNNEAEYKAAVNTLIEKVRSVHGENVNILWVVGMMRSENSNVNDWMKEVLTSLGGEREGLYTVTVTQNNEGGGGHPDLEANGVVANELETYIKSKGLI